MRDSRARRPLGKSQAAREDEDKIVKKGSKRGKGERRGLKEEKKRKRGGLGGNIAADGQVLEARRATAGKPFDKPLLP